MADNESSLFIRSLARREEFTRVVAKALVERRLLLERALYDFVRFSITEEALGFRMVLSL